MAVDGAKPLIIAQKEGRLYMEHEKTYIAPGTVFEGTVRATGDVQVDGEVIGEISSEGKVSVHKIGDASISARDLELLGAVIKGDLTVIGEVTLDEESAVQGNIRAASIVCGGAINGNLNASQSVVIRDKAKILGNIRTPVMDIARGALLRGQLQMLD